MTQINEWLSIDKANGSGDATITLTASSSAELTERMASLEIKGVTKSVYINITQDAYVAPSVNDNFWVKLDEDGDIQGLRTTFEYSYDLTNWNSCPTTLSVPADTYVWFRNTSSILNAENTSAILFTQRGSIGGDLSSMGDMRERNFQYLFNGNENLVDASELILPWNRVVNMCFFSMFDWCKNLTTAPELPATTLEGACYMRMFRGTALTTAPALPATILSFGEVVYKSGLSFYGGCYEEMFDGSKLTTAPVLPATTLADYCYNGMFAGCLSLTTAPVLPATTLAEDCYRRMFALCTSLTTTPELPATILVDGCYSSMFYNCHNLTTISHIGATHLTECESMFYGCKKLTEFEVGELVTDMSSNNMFDGCTNLKTIIAHPSTAPTIRSDTFRGITEDGTLIYPTGSDYSSWLSTDSYYLGYYGWNDTESGGGNEDEDDEVNSYFWVKLEESGEISSVKGRYTIQYSYDRENWSSFYPNSPISVPANTYVWFKNTSDILNYSIQVTEDITTFTFSTRGSVGGDLSSMGGMEFANFERLFYNNTNLTDASKLILPWDDLDSRCYLYMFEGCTSLVNAPKILPATILESDCYMGMFKGCTSLVNAPELPATNLRESSYYVMFKGCTSLTTAPELPATELPRFCYEYMFEGCTNLTMVECHAEDISARDCLSGWLNGVSPTGTFIKKQGVTYPSGISGIPEGWTIQEIS